MPEQDDLFSKYSVGGAGGGTTVPPPPSGGDDLFAKYSRSPGAQVSASSPTPQAAPIDYLFSKYSLNSAVTPASQPSEKEGPQTEQDNPAYWSRTWHNLSYVANTPILQQINPEWKWDKLIPADQKDVLSQLGRGALKAGEGFSSPLSLAFMLGTLGSGALWKTGATAALEAGADALSASEIGTVARGAQIAAKAAKAGRNATVAMQEAGLDMATIGRGVAKLQKAGMGLGDVLSKQGFITGGGGAVLRGMGMNVRNAARVSGGLQFLIDAGFTGQNIIQAAQESPKFWDAMKEGDYSSAAEILPQILVPGAFGALGAVQAGAHALHGGDVVSEKLGLKVRPTEEVQKLRKYFLGGQQRDSAIWNREATLFRDETTKRFKKLKPVDLEAAKNWIEAEGDRDTLIYRNNLLAEAAGLDSYKIPVNEQPASVTPSDARTPEEANAEGNNLPGHDWDDARKDARYRELASRHLLQNSDKYDEKSLKGLLDAYRAAIDAKPEVVELARHLQDRFYRNGDLARDNHVINYLVRGYTTNMWQQDIQNPAANRLLHAANNGDFHTNVTMARHRTFSNAFEGQLLGRKLAVTNPIELASHEMARVGEAVAARQAIERLKQNFVRASDGRPMVATSGTGEVVEGENGENPAVLVHPDRLRGEVIPQDHVDVLQASGQLQRFLEDGTIKQVGGRQGRPLYQFAENGPVGGNARVFNIANDYNRAHDLPELDPHKAAPNVDRRAMEIADEYERATHNPNDPQVQRAYSAFKDEVKQQWDWATKNGIKFEPWTKEGQPYHNSAEMMSDVEKNGHLYFFQGGETPPDHPLSEINPETGLNYTDMFRAVHDLFGHAKRGYQFGPKGEEGAFQSHSEMFSPLARQAMFTDTKAVNSWVNAGRHLRVEPPVEQGFTRLYRAEAPSGKPLPEWIEQAREESGAKRATGRWFTADRDKLDWYVKDAGENSKIQYIDVPTDKINEYKVSNQSPEVQRFSRDKDNEFFLPPEFSEARKELTKSIPLRGQSGFIAPENRPYAENKATVLPEELRRPDKTPEDILNHIDDPTKKWAIMQAENPNNERLSPEENAQRTEQLRKELVEQGYHPYPVEGHTKDVEGEVENAFFVPDITPAESEAFMKRYGQAGMIHNDGLVDLNTGERTPVKQGVVSGEEARDNPYYTVLKDLEGDVAFHIPLEDESMRTPGQDQRLLQRNVRGITPEEMASLSEKKQAAIRTLQEAIAPNKEIEEAARAGSIGRDWYRRYGPAFKELFGEQDFPAFTRLLAALSPRVPVRRDLITSINFWADWLEAGRPMDKESLTRIGRQNGVIGATKATGEPKGYKLPPNVFRALTSNEPLSGPKVGAFDANLQGNFNRATLDTWMYIFGGIKPSEENYLAFQSKIRNVADKMGWTTEQVQAAVWTFTKTLAEMGGLGEKWARPLEEVAKTIKPEDMRLRSQDLVNLIGDAFETRGQESLPGMAGATADTEMRDALSRLGIDQSRVEAATRAAERAHTPEPEGGNQTPSARVIQSIARRLEANREAIRANIKLKSEGLFDEDDEVLQQMGKGKISLNDTRATRSLQLVDKLKKNTDSGSGKINPGTGGFILPSGEIRNLRSVPGTMDIHQDLANKLYPNGPHSVERLLKESGAVRFRLSTSGDLNFTTTSSLPVNAAQKEAIRDMATSSNHNTFTLEDENAKYYHNQYNLGQTPQAINRAVEESTSRAPIIDAVRGVRSTFPPPQNIEQAIRNSGLTGPEKDMASRGMDKEDKGAPLTPDERASVDKFWKYEEAGPFAKKFHENLQKIANATPAEADAAMTMISANARYMREPLETYLKKRVIGIRPGEEMTGKSLLQGTPPFSPYHQYTEMVPIEELERFTEFDRSKEPLYDTSKLKESIRKNGIREPLVIDYNKNTRKALLVEGNHRIAVARELGLKELPVRVLRSSQREGGESVSGIEPDKHGYVPGDLKPSDIGIKSNPIPESLYQRAQRGGWIARDGTVVPVGANINHELIAQQMNLGESIEDALGNGNIRYGVDGNRVHFEVNKLTPSNRETIRQTLMDHFPNVESVSIEAHQPHGYDSMSAEDAIQSLRRGTPLPEIRESYYQRKDLKGKSLVWGKYNPETKSNPIEEVQDPDIDTEYSNIISKHFPGEGKLGSKLEGMLRKEFDLIDPKDFEPIPFGERGSHASGGYIFQDGKMADLGPDAEYHDNDAADILRKLVGQKKFGNLSEDLKKASGNYNVFDKFLRNQTGSVRFTSYGAEGEPPSFGIEISPEHELSDGQKRAIATLVNTHKPESVAIELTNYLDENSSGIVDKRRELGRGSVLKNPSTGEVSRAIDALLGEHKTLYQQKAEREPLLPIKESGWVDKKGKFHPLENRERWMVGHDAAAIRLKLYNAKVYTEGTPTEKALKNGAIRVYLEGKNAHVESSDMGYESIDRMRDTLISLQGVDKVLLEFSPQSKERISKTFDLPSEIGEADQWLKNFGDTFYQNRTNIPKGAVQFMKDGRAVLYAFKEGDFSTIVHELGHIFRRDLAGGDLETIEHHLGVKDGKWSENHEETWARWIERYFHDGKAPNEELKPIFARMAEWMRSIYQRVKGSAIGKAIPDEVRSILDKRFSGVPEEGARPETERVTTANKPLYQGSEPTNEYVKKAINKFGVINSKDFYSGPTWILPDGQLLDLENGEHDDIALVMDKSSWTRGIREFSKTGSIQARLDRGTLYATLFKDNPPTEKQIIALRNLSTKADTGLVIDSQGYKDLYRNNIISTTSPANQRLINDAIEKVYGKASNPLYQRSAEPPSAVDEAAEEGPPKYMWNTHGYKEIDHPAFHGWNFAAQGPDGTPVLVNGKIMVHPEAYNFLNRAVGSEKSLLNQSAIGKGLLRAGSTAKHTLLALSPFHIPQLDLRAYMSGVGARNVFMASLGKSPRWDLKNDPLLSLGVEHGLTLGSRYGIKDWQEGAQEGTVGGHGLPSKVPVIRDIQNGLQEYTFEKLLPNLKVLTFRELYKKYDKMFNDVQFADKFKSQHEDFNGLNKAQMSARAAAQETNERLGNLNYKDMGRSAGTQDFLRLATLAPDWLESELRMTKRLFDPSGGKVLRSDMVRFTAKMWVAARVLNLLFSNGKSAHNEAPFGVVAQDNDGREKVYSIRTLPTDMMHLANDPVGFLKGRASPFVRAGTEIMSGRDQQGRKMTGLQTTADILRNVVPIPVQSVGKALTGELPPEVGNVGQAVKALGGTVNVYKTEAEKKAGELASNRAESGPVDESMLRRHQMKMEWEDKLRSGEMNPTEVYPAVEQGAITAKEAKEIMKNVQETKGMTPERARLWTRASRLPMKDFMEVWDAATNDEKAVLSKLMVKKKISYFKNANKNLTPQERATDPVYRRLRSMFPAEPPW